ncbi:hypothetical protein VKA52_14465 [Halobacillus sp. HZG1]|uniref:hypothetical protein n=1 Tax=Halobacillus sp. HZG1 TaxID=3111769 RepID=UPI002DBE4F8F|nr:hypothetical protein [Halobacillus sp. HZG1]MEC3884936.1 hypothetical protein [Halobacillus sp. HZG1]
MEILIFLVLFTPFLLIGYFAYKSSGYQKGNIVMHLDEWYKDHTNYVKAIELELKNQGRKVTSVGKYTFKIDGKTYTLHPQIVTNSRVPTQRTVLIPEK